MTKKCHIIWLVLSFLIYNCKTQKKTTEIIPVDCDTTIACQQCLAEIDASGNLIPNGSFECYDELVLSDVTSYYVFNNVCFWNKGDSVFSNGRSTLIMPLEPDGIENVYVSAEPRTNIIAWLQGTPDLFNNVAQNRTNMKRAFDGNCCAGINLMGYSLGKLQRGCESLQTRLLSPMIKDSLYIVSWEYCSQTELFGENSFASNALGFALTDSMLFRPDFKFDSDGNYIELGYNPICDSNDTIDTLVTDKEWHHFEKLYKAKGGEYCLTIGDMKVEDMKFLAPDNSKCSCYYLIDNVVVRKK